jgi:hypothetical protein
MWFGTFLAKLKVVKKSLQLFTHKQIYSIGLLLNFNIDKIYRILLIRDNNFTNNALDGVDINMNSVTCKRWIYDKIINKTELINKIKFIYSSKDTLIVDPYIGKILEKSGFNVSYIEHGHCVCNNDKLYIDINNMINSNWENNISNEIKYDISSIANNISHSISPRKTQKIIDNLLSTTLK